MEMNKKIVYVFGANGQLGSEIINAFRDKSLFPAIGDVRPLTRKDIDFEDSDFKYKIKGLVDQGEKNKEDIFAVNTVAYHNFNDCEKYPIHAYFYNSCKVKDLSHCFRNRLFHISTDYVFGGSGKEVYSCCDDVNPINVYGMSKAVGETHVLHSGGNVIRVAGLYGKKGASMKGGTNFVKTIYDKLINNEKVLVTDTKTNITNASDVGKEILETINNYSKTTSGHIYHFTDLFDTAWYEVAKYIGTFLCKNDLVDRREEELDYKRPYNCTLTCSSEKHMRTWKTALVDFLRGLSK
jgi:dTDP-4-dehydrorhamnose reductase